MNDYQKHAQELANKIGMPVSFCEPATTPSVQNVTIVSQPVVLPTPVAFIVSNSSNLSQAWWLLLLAIVVSLAWLVWKK